MRIGSVKRRILRLKKRKLTDSEISKKLNIPESNVYETCKNAKVNCNNTK